LEFTRTLEFIPVRDSVISSPYAIDAMFAVGVSLRRQSRRCDAYEAIADARRRRSPGVSHLAIVF
jgi:hypothetical protein